MLGQWVPIRAEVAMLQGLSAHADYAEILQWLRGFTAAPRATFVTHGEPAAAEALRQRIVETLGWRAEAPEYLQTVRLD
jgi:metallo-beta-lactamase family protein